MLLNVRQAATIFWDRYSAISLVTEGHEPVDLDVDLAGVIGTSSVETSTIPAGNTGLGNCGHSVVDVVQRLVDASLGDIGGGGDEDLSS